MRTFLPKGSYMPWRGQYRPTFRFYQESPWTLVPMGGSFDTASQAISVAEAYMASKLNPPLRCETAPPDADPLGLAKWHEQRAAQLAETQEAALGGIISRGKVIRIERRARG